eukprot:g9027.t1
MDDSRTVLEPDNSLDFHELLGARRGGEAETPLFYWDWDPRMLLPRFGSFSRFRNTLWTKEIVGHQASTRLQRKEVWARYGRPMHFLTLEFAPEPPRDRARELMKKAYCRPLCSSSIRLLTVTEEDFTRDYLRRNKQSAEVGSLCLAAFLFFWFVIQRCSAAQVPPAGREPLLALWVVFLAQYLCFLFWRSCVYKHFQCFLFAFALAGLVLMRSLSWHSDRNLCTDMLLHDHSAYVEQHAAPYNYHRDAAFTDENAHRNKDLGLHDDLLREMGVVNDVEIVAGRPLPRPHHSVPGRGGNPPDEVNGSSWMPSTWGGSFFGLPRLFGAGGTMAPPAGALSGRRSADGGDEAEVPRGQDRGQGHEHEQAPDDGALDGDLEAADSDDLRQRAAQRAAARRSGRPYLTEDYEDEQQGSISSPSGAASQDHGDPPGPDALESAGDFLAWFFGSVAGGSRFWLGGSSSSAADCLASAQAPSSLDPDSSMLVFLIIQVTVYRLRFVMAGPGGCDPGTFYDPETYASAYNYGLYGYMPPGVARMQPEGTELINGREPHHDGPRGAAGLLDAAPVIDEDLQDAVLHPEDADEVGEGGGAEADQHEQMELEHDAAEDDVVDGGEDELEGLVAQEDAPDGSTSGRGGSGTIFASDEGVDEDDDGLSGGPGSREGAKDAGNGREVERRRADEQDQEDENAGSSVRLRRRPSSGGVSPEYGYGRTSAIVVHFTSEDIDGAGGADGHGSFFEYSEQTTLEHYFMALTSFLANLRQTVWLMCVQPNTQNAFLVAVLLLSFSYTMEILQRKDFIQATMVFRESSRSEQLLRNILPGKIVAKLKESYTSTSASYEDVSILFSHICAFQAFSDSVDPQTLVDFLNHMFSCFDRVVNDNQVEKIKTIGDGYMVACGLPDPNPLHAKAIARTGLSMLKMASLGYFTHPFSLERVNIRIGIHSGPCVAGVIGEKKFAFDIWGDAVNVASRMESAGEDGKMHCSQAMRDLIYDEFECENRGVSQVKGKGSMETYYVLRQLQPGKHFVVSKLSDLNTKMLAEALYQARSHLAAVMINSMINGFTEQLQLSGPEKQEQHGEEGTGTADNSKNCGDADLRGGDRDEDDDN